MDVTLQGWRGDVPDVRKLVARLGGLAGCEAQLLRADRVLGRAHLEAAVMRADRAFAAGRNVATAWPLEVLRYAAGERQIGRALELLGLAPGAASIAAVVRGNARAFEALAIELGWTRDDDALAFSPEKLAAWGASEREIALLPSERLADLALERVALADITR